MPYDALTIDTNMAMQGGLNLEAGLLGQLTQFKDGQIDLVLSDIVVREIRKHLILQVKKVRDTLVSMAARAEEVTLVTGDAAAEFDARIALLGEPRAVASDRLKRYLESTGATLVPVNLASMDELVRNYFASTPPFDPTGAKKSEFPDAIALMSIEAWAKKGARKVLAVSQDKGWAEFANGCDEIDVEPDFAKALQIVQEHADQAFARVSTVLTEIEAGALPDVATSIEEGLRNSLPDWTFHAEGGGSFRLEIDATELEFKSYALTRDEHGYDITVVRMGSSQIVARIGATFNACARADFSLFVWDSIDKEDVGMGSQTAEQEVEFEGAFLLTLSGNFDEANDALDVDEVEVVEAIDHVDFGEVELDHDDEDYEAWLAEDRDADLAEDVAQEAQAAVGGPAF